MSWSATLTVGMFTTALEGIVIRPATATTRHRPIIYCNSAAALPGELIGQIAGTDVLLRAVDRLTTEGHTIFAPDMDLTWGAADNRITDAIAYAMTMGLTGKPILIGASHGGACALHYAAAHPTDVSAVVGIIPAIDLTTLRNNDTLGQKAAINLAWGLASGSTSALPAGADPALQTAALSAVPIQLWTASDDPVSVNHASFAATTGAEDNNVGALGHTEPAIDATDWDAVAAFITEDF